MKKIILLSMIASGMLLADAEINNLTTDVTNSIGTDGGARTHINAATVTQGHTSVLGATTHIDGLTITQSDNKIDGDSKINTSVVHQGLTTISDSDITENSSFRSTNHLIDTEVTNSVASQALTTIQDSDVKSLTLTSSNSMTETEIKNGSDVSQSAFEMNDAEIKNSSIFATNNINNSDIDNSNVHQARVRIGGGYTVASLNMREINNLTAEVSGESAVVQGGLDVCSHTTDVSDWCED